MTLPELAEVILKPQELRESDKEAETAALRRTVPAPSYSAKLFKEKVGADFLRQGWWDLAEVEYGDKIGLINKLFDAELAIDIGRRLFYSDGYASAGRVGYIDGLALAMEAFKEVQAGAYFDLESVILAEYVFITIKLQACGPTDAKAITDLQHAIADFDDAFLALKAVADGDTYYGAELAYPHRGKYRYKGMPNDAFHVACRRHHARLDNNRMVPFISMAERELLAQRQSNLETAQAAYLDKQKAALAHVSQQTAP
jgi:hypothetical protein